MRFRMIIALAAAVVLAGCASSRAGTTRVAKAPEKARTVRTQTVTARPVARTIDAPVTARAFMPPPAPPISEASTRSVGVLRPAARRAIATDIRPASRPARQPTVIETAVKPLAPVGTPSWANEECPGGVCGIPDPCDPCPDGMCGIPDPCGK